MHHLTLRNLLPFLVAALWLAGSWWLLLGAPPLVETLARMGQVAEAYSQFDRFTWVVAMLLAMVLVDRAWVAWLKRRIGVDPMKTHWSRLRNANGNFFCAACRSIFMLPPEDFDDAKWVHCGDCGHPVAPYGEMKPLIHEHGRQTLARMARRLFRFP